MNASLNSLTSILDSDNNEIKEIRKYTGTTTQPVVYSKIPKATALGNLPINVNDAEWIKINDTKLLLHTRLDNNGHSFYLFTYSAGAWNMQDISESTQYASDVAIAVSANRQYIGVVWFGGIGTTSSTNNALSAAMATDGDDITTDEDDNITASTTSYIGSYQYRVYNTNTSQWSNATVTPSSELPTSLILFATACRDIYNNVNGTLVRKPDMIDLIKVGYINSMTSFYPISARVYIDNDGSFKYADYTVSLEETEGYTNAYTAVQYKCFLSTSHILAPVFSEIIYNSDLEVYVHKVYLANKNAVVDNDSWYFFFSSEFNMATMSCVNIEGISRVEEDYVYFDTIANVHNSTYKLTYQKCRTVQSIPKYKDKGTYGFYGFIGTVFYNLFNLTDYELRSASVAPKYGINVGVANSSVVLIGDLTAVQLEADSRTFFISKPIKSYNSHGTDVYDHTRYNLSDFPSANNAIGVYTSNGSFMLCSEDNNNNSLYYVEGI